MIIKDIPPQKIGLLMLLVLFFILKIPTMNVQYFWDESIAVSQVLVTLKENLNPILPSPSYGIGHPPFFYLTGALFYLFFGESPIVSHIYTLIFSLITIYFTYLLGNKLIGKTAGVIASALLMFCPVFFSQSGIFLSDMPLTALTVATLYFALNHDTKKYLITGSILVLIKEPGVITIFSILLFSFIENIKLDKKQLIKTLFILCIPLFIYFCWLVYHYFVKGWFFYQPWLNTITYPGYKLYDILKWVFFDQFRFIGLVFIASMILSGKYKYIFNKKMSLLWFNIFGYIFLFSGFSFFLPRYLLPIFSLLFILFSIPLLQLNKNIKFLTILVVIFLFFTQWFGERNIHDGILLESNMEYLDLVRSHKLTIDYILKNYPLDTVIFTDSPITDDLLQPFLHYTDKPFLNIIRVEDTVIDVNNIQLVVIPQQSTFFYEFKEKIAQMNLSLIKEYNINGKITEIYKNEI